MNKWIDRGIEFIDTDYRKVAAEAHKQYKKWGIQNHTPVMWLTILIEEVGELAKAIVDCEFHNRGKSDITKEAIQVTTIALKIARMNEEEK